MVRAAVCGTEGRQFESVPVYQKMNKEKKLSANTPSGFVDRYGKELALKENLIAKIEENFLKFGFSKLETPSFEISENIGKFLPDEDRPSSGVFGFQEENNSWISLRYDLTAPLARYVSQNYLNISNPFKRYQIGNVWRNEKPGPGRFREFTQADCDIVGSNNPLADAEMCNLLADTLYFCGLEKNQYQIKLSNRKLIQGLIENLKISESKQQLTVLRAIDKLDRVGTDGVKQLLTTGREDKSGDKTIGANLSDNQAEEIVSFINMKSLDEIKSAIPNKLVEDGVDELNKVLDGINYSSNFDQIIFSPEVIRGLEYYDGPIFEANLTFKVKNQKNQEVEFGSVGGGGRYNSLVSRFKKVDLSATGVSIGLDRLLYALVQLNKIEVKNNSPIIICVLDKKYLSNYYELLSQLRNQNIRSEVYLGDSGLKSQLKYADKRSSPAVILCGDDEFKNNKITIKKLVPNLEETSRNLSREEWKKSENTQITFDKENLIDEIKKLI